MSDSKSIVLPTFNGKDEAFQVWWTKFRAYATAKGVVNALLSKESDMPLTEAQALDETVADEKKKIKARERNSLAMAYLLSAFKAEADVSLAYETMTDDWPGGLAYQVVEKLMEIYQPKDNVTEVEVQRRLLEVKMKKKEDPKTLFEQVATIQNWYNSATKKLPKDQLIAVVLRAAPEAYASILTSEQEKRGNTLEMSHLRAVMNKFYRQVYKRATNNDEKDDEMALVAPTNHKGGNGRGSRPTKRFSGKCHTCGKEGHMARDCWEDQNNADKRPKWYKPSEVTSAAVSSEKKSTELQLVNVSWGQYAEAFAEEEETNFEDEIIAINNAKDNTNSEMMLKMAKDEGDHPSLLDDPEIWVIDTGATCNSTGHSQGMIERKEANGSKTKMGNGARVSSDRVGKIPFEAANNGVKGIMNDVHLMKDAAFNLVSGTKLLKLGYKLTGNADRLMYEKDGQKLIFDIKINTPEGMLFAARLRRTATEIGGAQATGNQNKILNIKDAHEQLSHIHEDDVRKTAAALGWTLAKGTLGACESCAIGKAKQKNVKTSEPKEKSQEVNGRVYLDISRVVNPKHKVQPRRPYWHLMVDEKTGYKSSSFFQAKDEMVEPTCQKLANWKANGMEVKVLRMDNGGENKSLVKRLNSKEWKLYPAIEYTARDTPQHNHLVEVGFATLYGRGRSMMIAANIPKEWKPVVAQKAFETATKLDGLIPVTIDGVTKPGIEHWCGKMPLYANHLRKWGEAGVVKIKTNTTPKMGDRGITCMMVGYAGNHNGDCYEMLNMKTKRVLETRDVRWLNRMYFNENSPETDGIEQESSEDESDTESDEESDKEPDSEGNEDTSNAQTTTMTTSNTGTTTRSGRVVKRTTRLIEEHEGVSIDEIMAVGAGIGGGFTHTSELIPMKYEQAMAGPKAKQWGEAVDMEHKRMQNHAVFKAVKKQDVPKFAKILTSTWAMKQKADGTLRARVNARGFEQRPGEHYEETGISSPVVNEASIFIILIIIIMGSMYAELNDVKGAFLNGEFSHGERLYMHVPKGFEKYYPTGTVLLLLKTIYGLKQAAFEYWKALLKALKHVGLTRSKADPCVYFRWTARGLSIWASWVDDLLSCGNKEDVVQGRHAIKKFFDLDEVGELKEYVGCKIEYNSAEGWMHLTQPVLIQSFEDEFKLPSQVYTTPAAPNSMLVGGEEGTLNEESHRNYRKGVGKLIHLAKYSKAEILNAVRELSRFGSRPNQAHYRAMIRAMRYCVSTKNRGLMLKPNKRWDGSRDFEFEITGKSDSDFAKCPETRRSVSGWTALLNGAPYVRKSKMQRFVTLSVTEAECVAATSCVQDMMYGKQFLESLGLKVKLPMILYMDNKGGVDIFNNWSIAGNTRSVSTRFAYIRELKEAGILRIEWIQSENNPADIFTKNTDGVTFKRHEQVYNGVIDDTENKAGESYPNK